MTPSASTESLYDDPPEKLTVKTALGDTAVHLYNSEAKETVLVTHGCGGRKEQYDEGRMAQRLASRYRVITFDWYGHGESAACGDHYTKEACLEQICRVIEELIPNKGQRFHLYGFSMGCFLSLHYSRLHPDRVDRLVLHSPWNGEMSVFGPGIRTSIKLPLIGKAGLAVMRKAGFPYCHDVATFKKIILDLGEGMEAWDELVDTFVTAENPREIFLICGEAEKPFYRTAHGIHDKLDSKSKIVSYPRASHMTWCEKWDQPVGSFYRDNIFDFLTSGLS